MLKKLIAIQGENDYQCDTLDEIVNKLVCNNYYELELNDKKNMLKQMAVANTLNKNLEIVDEDSGSNLEGKIVIKDEITYILSLLIANIIVLLERRDANIFVKNVYIPKDDNNYVIVNKFAKELLKDYLKNN